MKKLPGKPARAVGTMCVLWLLSCAHRGPTYPTLLNLSAEIPPELPDPEPKLEAQEQLWSSPDGLEVPTPPALFAENSVQGRPLPYWVLGEGSATVLILGGIHGDEFTSSELSYRFLAWALEHPDAVTGMRVVVAPLVNPDGLAVGSRLNANQVDLNRNFPAANWRASRRHEHGEQPASEPEARFVMELLETYQPVRVVSVHGAATCVNWDGPAEDLARAMSHHCGLPPRASIGYPTPGSLGSFVGIDRNTPIITLELCNNQEIQRPLSGYLDALLCAIHYPEETPWWAP